jgi:uncharacterized protein YndB with AHSA1/START domain
MKKWIKWPLIGIGALIALMVIATAVGAMLPRDHVASSTIALRQPQDSVWRVVRDFAGLPSWWKELTASVRQPEVEGRERWQQQYTTGPMVLEIVEDQPPQRLVTRIVPSQGAASYGGTWTYEVAAANGRSRVTVTEEGWVANPLLRFVARTMFGPHTTMDSYLKALGGRFGEAVDPVHLQ